MPCYSKFMKPKIFILIFLIITAKVADAQIMFQQQYGGTSSDQGTCVQQTTDNGYIITGGSFSFGNGSNDVYLIKTDTNGDTLWAKTYGGNDWDIGISVIQTYDGGFIISGQTSSFGNGSSDVYLIRTNDIGDTLWTKTFGGTQDEAGNSIIENTDGSFIIVGSTLSFTTGFSAAYIIKVDPNGNLIWAKSYEKLDNSSASDVKKNENNGYVVAGYSGSLQSFQSLFYLIKINENGDTIWTKTYSWLNGNIDGASIMITPDFGYVLSGSIKYPNGESDLCLMKTDTNGNQIWFKTYGGIGYQAGGKSCRTNDEGFVLTGLNDLDGKDNEFSYYSNGVFTCKSINKLVTNGDLYIIKINSNGDSVWSRNYGENGNDFGNSINLTNDNGFIICGGIANGNNQNVFLVKTNDIGFSDINKNSVNDNFLISPNPSDGIITIELQNNNNMNTSCHVYDFRGVVVYTNNYLFVNSYKDRIDLSELPSGLYFLHLEGENINISTKLIIIP